MVRGDSDAVVGVPVVLSPRGNLVVALMANTHHAKPHGELLYAHQAG